MNTLTKLFMVLVPSTILVAVNILLALDMVTPYM
jgi:hypothetical protein